MTYINKSHPGTVDMMVIGGGGGMYSLMYYNYAAMHCGCMKYGG